MKMFIYIPLLIFGLFWIGIIVVIDAMAVPELWQQIRSRDFPTTTGTITRSEVKITRGKKKSRSYRANIAYSYRAGGGEWTSDRIYFGMSGSNDRSDAEALVAAMPVGSEVVVYYDPQAPEKAVLQPGLRPDHLFIALLVTPHHLIGFGLLYAGIGGLARYLRGQTSRVQWRQLDDLRLVVRMPWATPLAVGMLTLGIAAFVSIFIVGFGFGLPPRMAVVVTAWAVVLVLALAAGLRQFGRIRAGHADLLIDAGAKTVTLPIADKRKSRLALAFAEVRELWLESERIHSTKAPRCRYHLALRTADGHVHRLHSSTDHEEVHPIAQRLSDTFHWPVREGAPSQSA